MKKLLSVLSLATFVTSLALPIVIASTSDAVAQSWGRRGANVRCTNGGSVNGRYYCNVPKAKARGLIR
jgi:hypothetical protein